MANLPSRDGNQIIRREKTCGRLIRKYTTKAKVGDTYIHGIRKQCSTVWMNSHKMNCGCEFLLLALYIAYICSGVRLSVTRAKAKQLLTEIPLMRVSPFTDEFTAQKRHFNYTLPLE